MALPGEQTRQTGGEWMRYQYKFMTFSQSVDASGDRSMTMKSTNRFGLTFSYRILPQLDVQVGGGRINLLKAYMPSLDFQFRGRQVGNLFQNFAYMHGSAGMTFYTRNLYLKGSLEYIPDVFRNSEKQAARSKENVDSGNFINEFGQGFRLSDTRFEPIRGTLYLAMGQEITLGESPANLEFGINFSPESLFNERVDFFWDGSEIGSNTINHTVNSVFVTVSQTLNFRNRAGKGRRIWVAKKAREKKTEEEVGLGDEMVHVGEQLVLENIRFERARADLDSTGQAELDKVFDFMRKYPYALIELSGHTSDEGPRRENIRLSEMRARACKDYLMKKGVAADRIETIGYGPKKSISDSNAALNRRVEMKILSIEP